MLGCFIVLCYFAAMLHVHVSPGVNKQTNKRKKRTRSNEKERNASRIQTHERQTMEKSAKPRKRDDTSRICSSTHPRFNVCDRLIVQTKRGESRRTRRGDNRQYKCWKRTTKNPNTATTPRATNDKRLSYPKLYWRHRHNFEPHALTARDHRAATPTIHPWQERLAAR